MIKLCGPLKNVMILFFLSICVGMTAHAQEDSLGADVEEYENLEDAALQDHRLPIERKAEA